MSSLLSCDTFLLQDVWQEWTEGWAGKEETADCPDSRGEEEKRRGEEKEGCKFNACEKNQPGCCLFSNCPVAVLQVDSKRGVEAVSGSSAGHEDSDLERKRREAEALLQSVGITPDVPHGKYTMQACLNLYRPPLLISHLSLYYLDVCLMDLQYLNKCHI